MIELDVPAPDNIVETTKGKIKLSDFRNRWVVLFAYPADFTPICEADIIGFAKKKQDFDKMGVQFIGWSVNTLETHLQWIEEIQTKTGVNIDYPLIADVHKNLAKRYGVLHKAKEVLYRGLFIIDPDGILKFAATYPLEVGRSTREVERIIRVLKRSRELSHLKETDRAKELSKFNE